MLQLEDVVCLYVLTQRQHLSLFRKTGVPTPLFIGDFRVSFALFHDVLLIAQRKKPRSPLRTPNVVSRPLQWAACAAQLAITRRTKGTRVLQDNSAEASITAVSSPVRRAAECLE